MTAANEFELMLTDGHPNSLGRTVEVVDIVLDDPSRIETLFDCYHSQDAVVRLRTSNAFKRIFRAEPTWFKPMINDFLEQLPTLDQASANWTLAQLCYENDPQLSDSQRKKAIRQCQQFLQSDDWTVLKTSLQALSHWARSNSTLKDWLIPELEKHQKDSRKTVANSASKGLKQLVK